MCGATVQDFADQGKFGQMGVRGRISSPGDPQEDYPSLERDEEFRVILKRDDLEVYLDPDGQLFAQNIANGATVGISIVGGVLTLIFIDSPICVSRAAGLHVVRAPGK